MLNKFITRKNSENCFVLLFVKFFSEFVSATSCDTHTHNRLTAVDPGLPG